MAPPVAPSAPTQQISDSQATRILTEGQNSAVTMRQQIYSATVFPPSNPVLNILPRNVGIIKRFILEVIATLTNGAGGTATLTDTGVANLIQSVVFADLNNVQRINTTGLHLQLLQTVKRRRPFAGTAQFNVSTGNNLSQQFNVPPAAWPLFQAPATIAANGVATVRAVLEVPLAYSDRDLRGAIFANVVNTSMNLQINFNTNCMVGAAPADYTYAVYQGSVGVFTQAVINVYQEYLDQLPIANGRYILPQTSLSTIYEIKNTNLQAITVGQNFPIPFNNFRSFLSVFLIFNNNGAATGRAFGTDVNFWEHVTANASQIFHYDPLYNIMLSREIIASDLPAGHYYFNYRHRPVFTTQNGNQQINLNANTATASAYVQAMWEDMQLQNTLLGGPSLPA